MRILNEGTEIRLLQFADDIALAASSEDGRMVWTHLSFHVAMLVPRDSGVLHSRSFGPQVLDKKFQYIFYKGHRTEVMIFPVLVLAKK